MGDDAAASVRMEPRVTSDEALMTRIKAGDTEAFGSLYDRFAPGLLALARRILRQPRESEDLVHDVFLEVFRVAASYDETRGTVRTWLAVRLRSRAVDRLRSARIARSVPLEEAPAASAAAVEPRLGEAERARVHRVVEALPADQRAVLELFYFDGLTLNEVAARQSLPIGTVKSRLARALKKLRAELAPLEEAP